MGRRMVMEGCIGHNEVPSSVGGRRSYSILVQFYLFQFVVRYMKNKRMIYTIIIVWLVFRPRLISE